MIREYIINLAIELNNQYPGIITEDKVTKAIEMYEGSDKSYDEIVSELEVLKEQLIKEYLDNQNKHNKVWYYSNAEQDERESRTFSQVQAVQQKVRTLLQMYNVKIYIAGGTVPYLITNQDSGRLHDDIDTICRKEDMDKLRQIFIEAGLYSPEWDSKNYSENGEDYGFEFIIDDVPFGFFPFEYDEETKIVTQYSADPYNKTCKTKTISVQQISDYIMTYRGADGNEYDTMSLEYIKLSKDNAGRPKDIADSKKIEETGLLRPEVVSRVKMFTETVSAKKGDLENSNVNSK